MGVYLKETASTYVPSPINVADNLYNRDRPDIANDPDVITGGQESRDELDGEIVAGVGTVAGEIADLKTRMDTVESGKSDVGHEHPISKITGLEAHLANIEQRLTNAGF